MQLLKRLLLAAAWAFGIVGGAATFSAQAWPARPIRVTVPWPAGGNADVTIRPILDRMAQHLGQSIVVENRAGGNNIVGAQAAAKMPADGYNYFFATTAATVINLYTMKSLPYDPLKDFDPLTILGRAPVFMMANPKLGPKTAQEFVALCKKEPGKINFGSGSASTRISGELLKAKAGIDMVHVPYKSTPLALQDTMSGHVQMCFTDPVTGLPQVKAGTVLCLGVGSRGRYKLTPEIPPLIEQGIPDFELMTWTGVLMPKGVPQPILAKLHEAIVKTITEPSYVARQAQGGSEIAPCSPEEMRRIQVAEIELYREMMKVAGIEPE